MFAVITRRQRHIARVMPGQWVLNQGSVLSLSSTTIGVSILTGLQEQVVAVIENIKCCESEILLRLRTYLTDLLTEGEGLPRWGTDLPRHTGLVRFIQSGWDLSSTYVLHLL